MEFRILGPLEVLSDGQALDLGGQKQRALLALLLLVFGAANLTLHTQVISPCDLRRLVGDHSEEVMLQGTLVRTPLQKFS